MSTKTSSCNDAPIGISFLGLMMKLITLILLFLVAFVSFYMFCFYSLPIK